MHYFMRLQKADFMLAFLFENTHAEKALT